MHVKRNIIRSFNVPSISDPKNTILSIIRSELQNTSEYQAAARLVKDAEAQARSIGKSGGNKSTTAKTSAALGGNGKNSSLYKQLEGIMKDHFDLGQLLNGKIKASYAGTNFRISASGSFELPDLWAAAQGDFSGLKFKSASVNFNGEVCTGQLQAYANYSSYGNFSGGCNFGLSNIAAGFGFYVADGEFNQNCSITRYSKNAVFYATATNDSFYIGVSYNF